MKHILAQLNQSYPGIGEVREAIRENFFIGLFVAAFLYLVRPFGFDTYDGNHLWLLCLGFGLVTYVMSVAFNFIVTDILGLRGDTPFWKLKHWILTMVLLILWIAAGNYVFSLFLMGKNYFDIREFLAMLYSTAIIGIFPIGIYGFLNQMRLQKKYESLAHDIKTHQDHLNIKDEIFSITSQRQEDIRTFKKSSFRYAQAMQNYVRIFSFTDAGIQQEIIRISITAMETQIADQHIIRCHRSFIVNLDHVVDISGNAQGLKLKLNAIDEEIPVSRSYISKVKGHLDRP